MRDGRPTRWIEDGFSDARFALRSLRKDSLFATVAVGALALGVGAATAIFSVAYPVLFEPLPYPDADQLVIVSEPDSGISSMAFGTYREVATRAQSVDKVAAYRPWQPTLSGAGTPSRLDGLRVSADYFAALGVAPRLGAGFAAEDDRPGGDGVVVLSDALWRQQFEADPDIVGHNVRLDGWPYRVVGVMPPDFTNTPLPPSAAWTLLQYDATLPGHDSREWGRHLGTLARLKPGVEAEAAQHELLEIGQAPVSEFARPTWANMENGLDVRPLKEATTAATRPLLLTLLGAVALLLLIACANVANLVLGRNAKRRGEVALRTALGASRGRVARQFLTESLTLSVVGGVLGVGLAALGVEGLQIAARSALPGDVQFGMDGVVLLFAAAVTTGTGLLVGLVPVLSLRAGGLRAGMEGGSTRTTDGRATLRQALVAAEVGLSLVLLIGAALLTSSLQRLFAVAPGFETAGTTVMQLQVAGPEFRERQAVRQFFDEALAAARAVPGVGEVALTSQLPLSGDVDMYGVRLAEGSEAQGGAAYRYVVTSGYLATMGIELLRGRALEPQDAAEARRVAVISEAVATGLFPDQPPLGQLLHFGRTDLPPFEVVGIVRDVKQTSLDAAPAGAIYITPEQWYFADNALWLVATPGDGPSIRVADIHQAVWSVNPDQPIVRTQLLEDLLMRSEAQRRFALTIFSVFAAVAWILAVAGLYGVVSGAVQTRLRELSVRKALGAAPRDIIALVVRQGMLGAIVGIVGGLCAAAAASRALGGLLYEVPPFHLTTYAGTSIAVAAVALSACWLPARRAARIDPARVLESR